MKKGMWFESFFLFLIFLVLTSALIVVSNKEKNIDWLVGERAFVMTDTVLKAEKAVLYLDQAAQYAAEEALLEYSERTVSSCGLLMDTPRWNSQTSKCFPLYDRQFQSDFLPFFRDSFSAYVREAGFLPADYYLISYFDDQGLHIVGKSDIPLILRISEVNELGAFPGTGDFVNPPLESYPVGTRFSFMIPGNIDTAIFDPLGEYKPDQEVVFLKAGTFRYEGYWIDAEKLDTFIQRLNSKGYSVGLTDWMDAEVSVYDFRDLIDGSPDLFVTDSAISDILKGRAPKKTAGNYTFSLAFEGIIRIPENEIAAIESKSKKIILECGAKDAQDTEECVRAQITDYSIAGERWGFESDCGVADLDREEAIICVWLDHRLSSGQEQLVLNFSLDLTVEAQNLIRAEVEETCADGTSRNTCNANYLCSWIKDPVTGFESYQLVENCYGFDNIFGTADDCTCAENMYCSAQKTCLPVTQASDPLEILGLSIADRKLPVCNSNEGPVIAGWCLGERLCSHIKNPDTGFETYQLVENCNGFDGIPGNFDDCPCPDGKKCVDGKCGGSAIAKPPTDQKVCQVPVAGEVQEIPLGFCFGSSKCMDLTGTGEKKFELVPDCLGDSGTPENPECHCPEFFRCNVNSFCEFYPIGATLPPLGPVIPEVPEITSCDGTPFNTCKGTEMCYSDGVFRQLCEKCGCPTGEECEGNVCVLKNDCDDIKHGECKPSTTAPGLRCTDGNLNFDCSCCPGGTTCNLAKDACVVREGKDVIVLDSDSDKASTFTIMEDIKQQLEARGVVVHLAREKLTDPIAQKDAIDALGGDYYFMIEEGDATRLYFFKYGEWIGRVMSNFLGVSNLRVPSGQEGKLRSVDAPAIRIVFNGYGAKESQAFGAFADKFFRLSITDLTWDVSADPRPSHTIDRVDIGQVYDVSKEVGIDYRILGGMIGQESGFNKINQEGDKKAHGLTQMFSPAVSQVETSIKNRFPSLKTVTAYEIYDSTLTSWDPDDLDVQMYGGAQYLLWVKGYLEKKHKVDDFPIEGVLQGYHDGIKYIKSDGSSWYCDENPTRCEESETYVPRIEEKMRLIVAFS